MKALITSEINCYWIFLVWFLRENKIERRLLEESIVCWTTDEYDWPNM